MSQSHSLQCPSEALPDSLQVMRTLEELGKDKPYSSPANEWLLTQSGGGRGGGVGSQACGWTRAVGTQVTLLLATFTLQSWPQSDTPKLPTSLPLGHFSYTDYHILDLPHSITGPLPHLPIRPPSPPSHSYSQHSEASVHSVYIALGPEGPNRDWVFTSSLPPRCQRASWVFFFFEQGV